MTYNDFPGDDQDQDDRFDDTHNVPDFMPSAGNLDPLEGFSDDEIRRAEARVADLQMRPADGTPKGRALEKLAPGARIYIPPKRLSGKRPTSTPKYSKPAYVKPGKLSEDQITPDSHVVFAQEMPRLHRVLIGNLGHRAVDAVLRRPLEGLEEHFTGNDNWLSRRIEGLRELYTGSHNAIENWIDRRRGHIVWVRPEATSPAPVPWHRAAIANIGHGAVSATLWGPLRRFNAGRHTAIDDWAEGREHTRAPFEWRLVGFIGRAIVNSPGGITDADRQVRAERIRTWVANGARNGRRPSLRRRAVGQARLMVLASREERPTAAALQQRTKEINDWVNSEVPDGTSFARAADVLAAYGKRASDRTPRHNRWTNRTRMQPPRSTH